MTWLAGVDGCQSGWFVALGEFLDDAVAGLQHRQSATLREVLEMQPSPEIICVDILDAHAALHAACRIHLGSGAAYPRESARGLKAS